MSHNSLFVLSTSTVTIAGQSATDEQLQGLATVKSDSHINTIFNLQDVQDSMALASAIGDIGALSNNVISTALSRTKYVERDKAIANAEANYKSSVSQTEWDAYVKNPDVGKLLKFEFDQKYATDPVFRAAYDKLSNEKKAAFIQDSINNGKPFGTLSSQEASWHQTQIMYGVGSDLDRATQAITGALSALAMGNSSGAAANLTQPYIANEIGNYFDKNTNETARLLAHAALGAAVASLSGNDPTSAAAGAVTGEVIAQIVIATNYPGKTPDELTLEERENVRAIATLASGLIGAATGGSFEDSATSAAAGYNSAANNAILYTPGTFSNSTNIDEDLPDALKKFYEDNKFIPIDLGRDLGNNTKDRELLADKIVEVIIAIKQVNPDEPIRLVGHSHGGNVDKLVTQKLVDLGYTNIVDDVMFIDTPVISDYVLNKEYRGQVTMTT